MGIEEVAIICFSVVTCFGVMAIAYFKSMERQEIIRQSGVTQRAQMKLGTPGEGTSPYMGRQEWWVPLVTSALQNPEIMKMVMPMIQQKLPSLIQGIQPKVE